MSHRAEEYQKYREALESFGRWCLDQVHEQADIDGWLVQVEAKRLGLLVYVTVTEPCGENCSCAEYSREFPAECLREPSHD